MVHSALCCVVTDAFTNWQEDDYFRCASESSRIESLYGHFFDATIVNENIDVAYEELLATVRVYSTGKHWVPSSWVMWILLICTELLFGISIFLYEV